MSSITELEFVDLLHQTRNRFGSPHFRITEQQLGSMDTEDEDQGLVMKLDSRIPLPAAVSPHFVTPAVVVPGLSFVLTSTSIFQSIPEVFLKKIVQLTELAQKEAVRLLPLFLYLSLLALGFQAIAVVVLLASAVVPLGLWFLLTCISILGCLFLFTSSLGMSQQPSPPPTPSQSSTSLSNYASLD